MRSKAFLQRQKIRCFSLTKGWLFANMSLTNPIKEKGGFVADLVRNGFLKSNGRKESGVQKAIILIELKQLEAGRIERQLRNLPGVTNVDSVTGEYDAVLTVEKDDLDTLMSFVTMELPLIEGIEKTTTCLAVNL